MCLPPFSHYLAQVISHLNRIFPPVGRNFFCLLMACIALTYEAPVGRR